MAHPQRSELYRHADVWHTPEVHLTYKSIRFNLESSIPKGRLAGPIYRAYITWREFASTDAEAAYDLATFERLVWNSDHFKTIKEFAIIEFETAKHDAVLEFNNVCLKYNGSVHDPPDFGGYLRFD